MADANGGRKPEAATETAKAANGAEAFAPARTRSPNYPVYKLESAVGKVKVLYDAFKRHVVPMGPAVEKWGMNLRSSTAAQAVAALKAYGLIDVQGTGDGRKLSVTDNAVKILAGHPDAPRLLKEAALAPKIHKELFGRFMTPEGLAPDATISYYLQFDRPEGRFADATITPFIRQFKSTISFAKLDSSSKMSETADETPADPFKEGEYVQWESQGALRFPEPRRVTGFADDGTHLFVEGTAAGIPVEQVRRAEPPNGKQNAMAGTQQIPPVAPVTPPAPLKIPPAAVGQKDFPLYLTKNQRAVLYVPENMTAKDYDLLKQQIENHLNVIRATSVEDAEASN